MWQSSPDPGGPNCQHGRSEVDPPTLASSSEADHARCIFRISPVTNIRSVPSYSTVHGKSMRSEAAVHLAVACNVLALLVRHVLFWRSFRCNLSHSALRPALAFFTWNTCCSFTKICCRICRMTVSGWNLLRNSKQAWKSLFAMDAHEWSEDQRT